MNVWKLRTMHVASDQILATHLTQHPEQVEAYQRTSYLPHDPRIAGQAAYIARRFGIDELPQLWNVIAGDMSLVGPRPLEEHLRVRLFSEPERAARASVKPGLTGLWQVRRRTPSVRSLRRYDQFYISHRSWKLDLWLLSQTPGALLSDRGA